MARSSRTRAREVKAHLERSGLNVSTIRRTAAQYYYVAVEASPRHVARVGEKKRSRPAIRADVILSDDADDFVEADYSNQESEDFAKELAHHLNIPHKRIL